MPPTPALVYASLLLKLCPGGALEPEASSQAEGKREEGQRDRPWLQFMEA